MSDLANRVQVIVCYSKCWSCMTGECQQEWHTWADEEDIAHAAKTSQPDPSKSRCGCYCQRDQTPDPAEQELADDFERNDHA